MGGASVGEERGWPWGALGALRHPAHPAVFPGCRDAANPDTRQLPRVLPQQARGPLHPLESRRQLEREFPQDQREGVGRGTLTAQPWGTGRVLPTQPYLLPLPVPQENEKSPSQNRKAKDATSDNGKGRDSGTPAPRPLRPSPQPSLTELGAHRRPGLLGSAEERTARCRHREGAGPADGGPQAAALHA